jgi:hypothetical protein
MRLSISAHADARSVSKILRKMSHTINANSVGYKPGENGAYTRDSCYGNIANFLRDNWNPEWRILLFGDNPEAVVHAVLWDPRAKKAVLDTGHNLGAVVGTSKVTGYLAHSTSTKQGIKKYAKEDQVLLPLVYEGSVLAVANE